MNSKAKIVIGLLLMAASFFAGTAVMKKNCANNKLTQVENTNQNQPTPIPFVPKTKSDKPEVKFFVMSFCPYGNQAEAGLEPVYQLLKDKVIWSPRYILSDKKIGCEQSCPFRVFNEEAKTRCKEAIKQGQVKDMETCQGYFPYQTTDECLQKECAGLKAGELESLHGAQELNQDIREICAFIQGNLDKWWKFVVAVNDKCTAQNADNCWTEQAKSAGLDTDKVSQCEKTQIQTLAAKEMEEANKYQASGSPTVLINETLFNGGRGPEDYKKAICNSFNNPPKECNTILGQETAAVSGGCN